MHCLNTIFKLDKHVMDPMPTHNQKVMENVVKDTVFSQHYTQSTKEIIQLTKEITLGSRVVISSR